jgi:hypothetical protein
MFMDDTADSENQTLTSSHIQITAASTSINAQA